MPACISIVVLLTAYCWRGGVCLSSSGGSSWVGGRWGGPFWLCRVQGISLVVQRWRSADTKLTLLGVACGSLEASCSWLNKNPQTLFPNWITVLYCVHTGIPLLFTHSWKSQNITLDCVGEIVLLTNYTNWDRKMSHWSTNLTVLSPLFKIFTTYLSNKCIDKIGQWCSSEQVHRLRGWCK